MSSIVQRQIGTIKFVAAALLLFGIGQDALAGPRTVAITQVNDWGESLGETQFECSTTVCTGKLHLFFNGERLDTDIALFFRGHDMFGLIRHPEMRLRFGGARNIHVTYASEPLTEQEVRLCEPHPNAHLDEDGLRHNLVYRGNLRCFGTLRIKIENPDRQ